MPMNMRACIPAVMQVYIRGGAAASRWSVRPHGAVNEPHQGGVATLPAA